MHSFVSAHNGLSKILDFSPFRNKTFKLYFNGVLIPYIVHFGESIQNASFGGLNWVFLFFHFHSFIWNV